jgi:SRSO17 transposase
MEEGLEANAVFVSRPHLDAALRERGGDLAQERAQSRLEGRLRHGVRLHVTRAWLEEACAQAP